MIWLQTGRLWNTLRRRALTPLQKWRHKRARRRSRQQARTGRHGDSWWNEDPHWFPGGTPPRRHNRITPLVDGEQFFAALFTAINDAKHYIYIAGWCMTPQIPLQRGDDEALVETRLQHLLREKAQEIPVRVLLWSGAPFLFPPTTGAVEAVAAAMTAGEAGDLRCGIDRSARFSHCHHQKAIVVDGQVAFVGGMDLTTFQGDRWDTNRHPLRAGPNWHDVQIQIEGEAVADVEHNFRQRWSATQGEDTIAQREPQYQSDWQTPVQILRTIPQHVYQFAPHGEFGIHYGLVHMLRRARRLIYLENQYLWAPEIMDALSHALEHATDPNFRVVIVLPAHAYDGKLDNDLHVKELLRQDQNRGRVSVYSLYTSGLTPSLRGFGYRPVYVHAKVTIVDDEWLAVGSANLNDRGLATDSEIVALSYAPQVARDLRINLWAEHLSLPRQQIAAAEPQRVVDHEWRDQAERNATIVKQGARPLISAVHRYEYGNTPGSLFLDEAEALTVEH